MRGLSPKPTSLTTTGTSAASTMASSERGHDENARLPSGMTVSCTAFRCTCSASASSRATARRASSGERSTPTFANTKPSGFSSRMTRKVGARAGSSSAALTDPDAIASPVSRAAIARSRLMRPVAVLPPVMALR